MKFVCHACAARYYIDDAKVAGKVLSIRCKRCSAMIAVRDPALPLAHPPAGSRRATQALAAVAHELEAAGAAHAGEQAEADDAEAWHYSINGETYGPYTEDELVARYQAGTIGDETYVWRPGYSEWLAAIDVPVFESAIEAGRSQRMRRGAPRTQNLDAADVLSALSATAPAGPPPTIPQPIAARPASAPSPALSPALSTTLREAPPALDAPVAAPVAARVNAHGEANVQAPVAALLDPPAAVVEPEPSATPPAARVWPADAPTIEQTAPPAAAATPEPAQPEPAQPEPAQPEPAQPIEEFAPQPHHEVPLAAVRPSIPAELTRAEPDPDQFLPTPEEQDRLSFGAIALSDHGHAPVHDHHHAHHEPARRGSRAPLVVAGLVAAAVIGAIVVVATRDDAPAPVVADAGTSATPAAASASTADAATADVVAPPRPAATSAAVQVAVLRTSRVTANAFAEAREAAAAVLAQGAVTNAVSALRYVEEPTVVRTATEARDEGEQAAPVEVTGRDVTAVAPPSPGRVALPTTASRGTQGIYGQLGSSAAAPVPTVDPSLAEPQAASGPSAEHFANGLRTFVESSIQRCHQRQVTEEGSMPVARVEVELTVQSNGRVSDVSVGRQLVDTTFDRCLQGHRERWSFGPFAGEAVTLQKTYVLQ